MIRPLAPSESVDVPGSTSDCNMRGLRPLGARTRNPRCFGRSITSGNPGSPLHGTIEAIYGMIVTQAREPLFYRDLGVPDTVNGRFDLLLLHLWLVLRRLKSVEAGTGLSQALFDHFCEDMDDNLREMGVGDLAVPKRMEGLRRGVLWPFRCLRHGVDRWTRGVRAGAVQERLQRREDRKGERACRLCRGRDGRPGGSERGGAA